MRTKILTTGVVLLGLACNKAAKDLYPALEDYCAARAHEECQIAAKCVIKADACETARKATCVTAAGMSMSPTRLFRSENVQACVDKTHEVYMKGTITPDDLSALDDLCGRVFSGTNKERDACDSSFDCTSPLVCDKTRCATKVVKKKGEGCANPGEVCEPGALCVVDGSGLWQCIGKKIKGESCDAKDPCIETLRCVGTCVDRLQTGQPCQSDDDCAPAAPYCDPYIGRRCDLGLIFAPNAAACSAYGGSGTGDGGAEEPEAAEAAEAAGIDASNGDPAGG